MKSQQDTTPVQPGAVTDRNSQSNNTHRFDFKQINEVALSNSTKLLTSILPGGAVKQNRYTALNPTRNDKHAGSFGIDIKTGAWGDFATHDTGIDFISFTAYICGISQYEAAKKLAEILQIPPISTVTSVTSVISPRADNTKVTAELHARKCVTPFPDDVPPPEHSKKGPDASVYSYRGPDGKTLVRVHRFDSLAGKEFLPQTYNPELGLYQWKAPLELRPLYNLPEIVERVDATIAVVEGERTADSATILLPDYVVTTTMSGAQSPHKTDWSFVQGRNIIIWPDNDEAGQKYAHKCRELALAAGARSVQIVDLTKVANGILPKAFDLADDLESNGLSIDGVRAAFKDCLLEDFAPPIEPTTDNLVASGHGFTVSDDDGVVYRDDKQTIVVCSSLKIVARSRDVQGRNWAAQVEFKDPAGRLHRVTIPNSMLNASGESVREMLMDRALFIQPNREAWKQLNNYLQVFQAPLATSVNKIGWHEKQYVLPKQIIGLNPGGEQIFYQPKSVAQTGIESKGTLEEWQRFVARPARKNSRIMFAICVALAGPTLHLVGEECGGFHLRGISSSGKTTLLYCAASVHGSHEFILTWRTTDNGLEAVCVRRNDSVLLLDEIGQVDARLIGNITYQACSGKVKLRATQHGDERDRDSFKLLMLSSGETGISHLMASVGQKTFAGQETRIADIPVDAGAVDNAGVSLGAFEELHEYPDGEAMAKALKRNTEQYYGVAGVRFIESLAARYGYSVARLKERVKFFVDNNVPKTAGGQVHRVGGRFGLVAAAGELATEFGITGWLPGEATDAAKTCFDAWLANRGTDQALEPKTIMEQVRLYLEQHGDSRFTKWEDQGLDDRVTINRAGYKRITNGETKYIVFRETFKTEVCKGLDPKSVSGILVDQGWLETDKIGNPTKPVNLPGTSRSTRCYVLTSKVLTDDEEEQVGAVEFD